MSEAIKICPQCEAEYALTAAVCADCGVDLVSPDAMPAPAPAEPFPDVSELECVRLGPLPWTRALSEALSEVGIEHRVERDTRTPEEGGIDPRRFGSEAIYGTWVRDGDLAGAAEIDRRLFGHLQPDAAGPSTGTEQCPACEEPIPEEALECPGCGLAFG